MTARAARPDELCQPLNLPQKWSVYRRPWGAALLAHSRSEYVLKSYNPVA
ncbi:hypothetical protein [Streptomyces nigrescens]